MNFYLYGVNYAQFAISRVSLHLWQLSQSMVECESRYAAMQDDTLETLVQWITSPQRNVSTFRCGQLWRTTNEI